MTQMIFTGVFERFPELQMCWIETGVGWIPHFIESIDDRYWRNRVWGDLPITEPPSSYWYRNNAATFITDRSGYRAAPRRGRRQHHVVERLPAPRQRLAVLARRSSRTRWASIPNDEKVKITGGNAARIWHLERLARRRYAGAGVAPRSIIASSVRRWMVRWWR